MPLRPEFWDDPAAPHWLRADCEGCQWDKNGNCTAELRLVRCPLDKDPEAFRPSPKGPAIRPLGWSPKRRMTP